MKFLGAAALFIALIAPARALNVPNFAAADLVLGQPNFSTADLPSPPSAASLAEPSAVVVDPASGKVFVADTDNNRVLRYANAATLQQGAAAEAVFGQPNFSDNSALPPGPTTLDSPTGLCLDSAGRLWVADSDNHRVLRYANAASVTGVPAASLVLGQPDAATENPATSRAGMNGPTGLCVDSAGRLWVADAGNNRVLRFDGVAGKSTGADADAVLGQSLFDTSSAGTSAQQLAEPASVTMDPDATLWVADRANHRLLGFPSAGTVSSGTNAARILGQPDFNGSVAPGTTPARINGPTGVFADAVGNLWVLDQGNNRVLRFANLKSIENGQAASAVIGQPDFFAASTALDARHVSAPFLGLFVQPGGQLWVSDLDHHRVLRFQALDDQPPTVRIPGKTRRSTKKARVKISGFATDDVAVTRVTLQLGKKKPVRAFGTARWSKTIRLTPGRNRLTARAFDATGKKSRPARIVISRN